MSRGSCSFPISAGTSAALAQGELQRGLYCLDPHKGPESVCGVCAQVCGRDAGLGSTEWQALEGSLNTLLPPLSCPPGLCFPWLHLSNLHSVKGIPVGHVCLACQDSLFPTRLIIVSSACLTTRVPTQSLCAIAGPQWFLEDLPECLSSPPSKGRLQGSSPLK